MIREFRGEYYFLSNFSTSRIEYDGYVWYKDGTRKYQNRRSDM